VEEAVRGLGVVKIRRLKQLEKENAKLKRLVADLSLDKTMLQDVLRKEFCGPPCVATWRSIFGRPTRSASGGPTQPPGLNGLPSGIGQGAIRSWRCGCA